MVTALTIFGGVRHCLAFSLGGLGVPFCCLGLPRGAPPRPREPRGRPRPRPTPRGELFLLPFGDDGVVAGVDDPDTALSPK